MNSFISKSIFVSLFALAPIILFAKFKAPENVRMSEVSTYLMPKSDKYFLLPVDYAKAPIKTPEVYKQTTSAQVYRIELVFTRYPKDFEDWRTDYNWLLEERLKELYQLDSSLFDKNEIEWRYILQTGPTSEPEAMTYFHGWVIHYSPIPLQNSPTDSLIELGKENPDIDMLSNIIYGQNIKLADSSAYKTLQKHSEWEDMLVVMDWTASMYRNGASVLHWHRKHLRKESIKHLVIFNDGAGRPHIQKKIGRTGGLYPCEPNNLEQVILTMVKAKNATLGGDAPENDMEALVKSAKNFKDYKEVILIPDRNSSVRDLTLVRYMKKPVRIILFQNKKIRASGLGSTGKLVENHWIHPNYLTIASMTGGSIHIGNLDITGLDKLKPGETFVYHGAVYEKQENGIFKFGGYQ